MQAIKNGTSSAKLAAVEALPHPDKSLSARDVRFYLSFPEAWALLVQRGVFRPLIALFADIGVGDEIAQVLAKSKNPQLVELLIDALKHSNQWVGTYVSEMQDKLDRTAPDVLASWVRNKAVEVLGQLGDARAVQPLIEAVKSESGDSQVKEPPQLQPWIGFRKALIRLASQGAVKPELLLALLSERSSIFLRSLAGEILGSLGDQRAVGPLADLLRSGCDGWVAPVLRKLRWQPSNSEERLCLAIAEGEYHQAAAEGAAAIRPLVDIMRHSSASAAIGAVNALESLGWTPSDSSERAAVAMAREDFDAAAREGFAGAERLWNYIEKESYWCGRDLSGSPERLVDYAGYCLARAMKSCLASFSDEKLTELAAWGDIRRYSTIVGDFNDVVGTESEIVVDLECVREVANAELARRAALVRRQSSSPTNQNQACGSCQPPASDSPLLMTCVCGTKYKVKRRLAGKRVKCAKCNKVMVVPQA